MFRITAALLMGVSVLVLPTLGHTDEPNKVIAFMRLKLDRTQKLLEGIALEDFAIIEKNAQALSLLCEDELWQVEQTPEYLQHSEQFRRLANDITKAAQAKNVDGAALGYVGLTMKCVQCHKHVRDVRMAGQLDLSAATRIARVAPSR